MQQKPQTWRDLLGSLNESEKRRIVEKLEIQGKTLDRWISGHTGLPRSRKIQQLFTLLPANTRPLFVTLLQQDPGFAKYANEIALPRLNLEIPSAFYARILETNVSTTGSLRFTAVCQLTLEQAIGLLDPDSFGLYMTILKCTPSSHGGKIRSLRQQSSMGTHPWSAIIDGTRFFFGEESVVGQAVMKESPFVLQDIHSHGNSKQLSIHQDEYVVSTAALRIQREGRIAGALLVASTQANFFTPSRLAILQQYCNLVVVAIGDDEFYQLQQIEFGRMPPVSVQQEYIAQIHKRISARVKQAPRGERLKMWPEAERDVIHQIEDELLALAAQEQTRKSSSDDAS